MNRTVMNGTPRTNSMKRTLANLTTGICERRPSASRTPSGSEKTMPTTRGQAAKRTCRPTAACRPPAARARGAVQQDETRGRDRRRRTAAPPARVAARRATAATTIRRAPIASGEIDAPALRDRIGAEAEVVELGPDERPAGAILMLPASFAVRAAPDGFRRRPGDQRRQQPKRERDEHDGRQARADRGEQIRLRPGQPRRSTGSAADPPVRTLRTKASASPFSAPSAHGWRYRRSAPRRQRARSRDTRPS